MQAAPVTRTGWGVEVQSAVPAPAPGSRGLTEDGHSRLPASVRALSPLVVYTHIFIRLSIFGYSSTYLCLFLATPISIF